MSGRPGARFTPLRLLTTLLLVASTLAPRAEADYRFGVIPQFGANHLLSIWTPILDEVSRRSGLQLTFTTAADIPEFEALTRQGAFDFAYMNPYQYLRAEKSQGYEPLVRDGERTLFGILVVPAESPIQTVAELEGQTVAFPTERALAASLLLRAELETLHGVAVEPLYEPNHSAAYAAVLMGRAAAAGGVLGTLQQQGPRAGEILRILFRTREMPPHPVVAHARVPAEHREAVRRALLEMAATEQGAALLARVPMEHPVPAIDGDYRPLQEWRLERHFAETP